MTSYALATAAMFCLWAALFFAMWDGGDVFGAAVGALVVAFIALLPAAFLCGLIWRCIQIIGDAVWWIRYRRLP